MAWAARILPGLPPTDSDPSLDLHWSARALELALRADYKTSPNPMVGAVVVDAAGNLAGEGYHRQAGQPHAGQEALAAAGHPGRGRHPDVSRAALTRALR